MPSGFWERLSRVSAASNEGRAIFLTMLMGAVTIIAALEALLLRSWAPLGAALFGWAVVGGYIVFQGSLFEKAGEGIGSITVPSGSSTPSVAQHSNIEAMEARGAHAGAAAAYRQVIAADPRDVVACEKLARLAQFHLKDVETAIWAYHQAEQRTAEPRRQMGFALLALGLYRDGLKDTGRTIVEIRKFLARWPDAPNAAELRVELETLRQEHFKSA